LQESGERQQAAAFCETALILRSKIKHRKSNCLFALDEKA
jgi:hypothetical protein